MQVRYPKMVERPVTTLDASVLVVKSFWEPSIGCVGGRGVTLGNTFLCWIFSTSHRLAKKDLGRIFGVLHLRSLVKT